MIPSLHASDWNTYRTEELARIRPEVERLGYALDETQVHIGGERSVISSYKLVLLGRRVSDQARVVIKASSHPRGREELKHARACQALLNTIHFAHKVFLSPEELVWEDANDLSISITAFIEQPRTFLERSFEEQFFLALKAFELQESAHATTYGHLRAIRASFGLWDASTYLEKTRSHISDIRRFLPDSITVHGVAERAEQAVQAGQRRIEQYGGFLTHTDFVPHNIRTVEHDIYLLDHSAIRFGNKYDGWARFLNFMVLYHQKLEQALVRYVKENRAPEESESLRLMRIVRYIELIRYYAERVQRTTGALHALDEARILFWTDALEAILAERDLSPTRIKRYQDERDALRSDEEKRRQEQLH